jgi:hypothetical protein
VGGEDRGAARVTGRKPGRVGLALPTVPHARRLAEEPLADLYAAHRTWVANRVTAATKRSPRTRCRRLAGGSHAMIDEQPAALATATGDFLAAR